MYYIVSQMDDDLTAELEQLSQGVHFKDLTKPSTSQQEQHPSLLNSLTQDADEETAASVTPVPMAGQCSNRLHFNMALGSPMKSKTQGGAPMCSGRLKHCRNVSQKWLERCKPDLAEFEPPSERLSDSEGAEVERGSGEESEGKIEDIDELEDSDGLCDEDLWEEEEGEGEEQEVEPNSFDLEHIHDNQGEEQGMEPQTLDLEHIHDDQRAEHHSPQPRDDLNRVVGHCNLDLNDQWGWDDYDEGSSGDDSSSEENPVINSHFGEQFETKWEELSNSVTTLSPLKQLPVKSSPPQTTSQSSKKRLILAPRTTPTSTQSSAKPAQCHTNSNTPAFSSAGSVSNNQSTGLSHLRDGMSLLELYGSKGHPVSAPTESTLSLVHRLSSDAESANKRPSHSRSSNKKTNLWTLQHSAHAKNFVSTAATLSATSSMTQLDCYVSKQISSTDAPPRQPDAKLHPPSIQAPSNPTSKTEEYRSHTLTDSVNISDSILATLDHETNTSKKQENTDSSKTLMGNFDSDIDLLSQEESNMLRSRGSSVSMATTSRGRSLLRRGRGRVHSTAAVISEVEQLGHGEESDRHSEPGGKARDCGIGKDREMDEREGKVISSGHKR